MDTLEVRSKIGRFATCNGNAKSARVFPRGNGVYCLMHSNKLITAYPTGGHVTRAVDDLFSKARLFISRCKRRAYLTKLLDVLSTVPLLLRMHVASTKPRGAGS